MVIVVNPSLKFVHLSHLSSVNVVFVMCELSGKSILLCNVYLPPSCDPSPLLDKINFSLNSLNYDEVIFCGDLNVESFRWSDKPLLLRHHSSKRDLVENFIDAKYLHVLNTHGAVTWEEGNRSSSIDVTCCSAGLVNSVTDWHPEYQELSDHKRLVFNLNFAPSSQDNTRFKLNKFSQIYFSFGRADWDRVFEHFSKKIENINLFLENVRDSSSLDDVINLLGEEIFHTCLNTIPSRPRSDKYLKSISWWKSDLNPLKRATQKAQRAFIKARGVVKGVLEVFYKRLKARYRRARRLAKKEAWRAACSRCEISPWGGIYSFIKGNFKRKPLSALPVGSGFTEGPRDTLNHVLDYYFGRVPPDTMLEHKDLSKVIASSSDNDPLFTDNELLLTADKVNLSSSPGSDGMPPLLIVKLVKHFRTFFLSIFNMCLTTGHFPSTWKLGDVVLVPKRSGEDFLASHRPITMLPGLGKILERLILARLSWMADRMCKAPPNQFGFKPCRSTTAALLNLKSTITRTIKNRKSCLLLSFDVKGAFDNVLHSSILRALHKSVCPRNIYHLINSFLCNRVVRLSMNGCTVSRRISKGCPQGSVLGPFLWNIVFDELLTLDYRNNVFPQAYADDLVVVVSGCRPSQLPAAQHTIDMIARWCSLHKLELSVGKCQAMVLLRPHGRLPEPRRDLVIHGRPIQWCDSIKVLGVRFDQRLSFYQHVVEVCAKVRGMLPRLTAAANLNFGFGYRALRTLYLQVVVPAIAYASAVWFPNLSQRSLNVLLSAQRPFLVRACRAFRSTSNAALISLSRVLPLDLEILAKTELYLKKYGLVDAEIPLEPPPFPHPLPYPPYYSAPSNIPALFFHVAYYTDGSKTRDGVGAGVYRFSCLDCAPEIRESHVLSPHCSVFQAEALGLVKALENATTLPNHLTLGFFLDNLSVVKSVMNSKTGNYLIDRALLLISRLNRNGNRCTIQWIKGHSGNVGNDIADTLAKRGAESADPSCYKLAPLSFVKSAIYGRAREAWESRFLSLAPSIHTRFGLTPMSLLDKRYAYIVPSEHIVVGLLTGHTWTDSFAHRIGVIDDPSCPYCDADREETLSHIVLECSSLDALRFPLLSTCAEELGYTPRSLKDFIFNRSTWRACLEFLKASDRLKPRMASFDDHAYARGSPDPPSGNMDPPLAGCSDAAKLKKSDARSTDPPGTGAELVTTEPIPNGEFPRVSPSSPTPIGPLDINQAFREGWEEINECFTNCANMVLVEIDSASKVGQDTAPLCTIYRNVNGILAELQKSAFGVLSKKLKACDLYTEKLREDYENKLKAATAAIPAPAAISAPAAKPAAKSTLIAPSVTKTTPPVNVSAKLTKPSRPSYAQTLRNSANHVKLDSDVLSVKELRAKIAQTPSLKNLDVAAVTGGDKKLVLHFTNPSEKKRFVDNVKTANIGGLKVQTNPTFKPRLAIFGIPGEKTEEQLVADIRCHPAVEKLLKSADDIRMVKLIRKEGSSSTAIIEVNKVIFCGDLNIESYRWSDKARLLSSTCTKRETVENFLDANLLHVVNEHGTITWEERNSSSSIDVTCCSAGLVDRIADWNAINQALSDHKRLVFSINFDPPSNSNNNKVILNSFSEVNFSFGRADWEFFFSHFKKKIFHLEFLLDSVSDTLQLDNVITLLSDEVFHSCIQTIPSKPNKPGKIKNASWWKPEFNPLQRATLKAERAWRRARGAVRGVLKVFHKKLYNRFRATIRKAKQEEWKRVCSQCEVNPWGGIYQFIRGKHKKKPLSSLSVGAGFTDSQRDTLDHVLQHYFGRVPPDSMLGHSNLHRALQSISDNDPPFSEVELQLAADKVRLSSSPGSDGMPPVLCVKLIKKFRPFFLKIFNRCLVTGHFPAPWKLGDVILIPKKGGEDFLASHRPITMLPSLGKILERLILARLSWRAERMCKAQPNQFGFRPCKSTIAALLKLKNTLSRSLDLFKSAILLSFDVKGAFDNVLHSSILRALRKSDCPKNVHDLIRSFLAHRSVRLSVNGCTVTRRVSKGCPQGSVLGPFLWNIVFDELLTLGYKNSVFPQAYADDLVVVISGLRHGQLSKAQHAIDLISDWCGLHKLELSVSKCQAMFVQKPLGRIRVLRRDLVSNGQVVQWCDSIRVLGVRFDNRLTFHQHVAEVCSKVRGMLPRLSAAANFNFGFGFRALRMLYLQVVIPVVAYASPVWFPNLFERSRKLLLSTQRFFLILACRAFRTTNNSSLITLSRVLPLDLEIDVKTQLYLKKYGYVDAEFPVEPPPSPQPLPYPPFLFLPSNIPELPPEVTYYTDGSKTNDGVGAGLYRVCVNDNFHELRVCYPLSRYCSVFQAEAFGLIKALENASELPIDTTVEVLLDNLSVVNSVLNCRTGNFLINRALLLISQLNRNGNRCSIRWIKGHSGIVGNDVADALAKSGAGSDLPSCYRLAPLSKLESTARKLAWAAWQSRFSSTTRPICTRFGLTPMSFLDKKYTFIVPSVHAVVGLLSGHTWTDSFSHKMGFIDDPTCPYCDSGAEETLEHILLECDSLDSLRTRLLFIAGKELGHTPRSLRDFIHSKSAWHACVDFLLASDRLKPRIREEDSEEMASFDDHAYARGSPDPPSGNMDPPLAGCSDAAKLKKSDARSTDPPGTGAELVTTEPIPNGEFPRVSPSSPTPIGPLDTNQAFREGWEEINECFTNCANMVLVEIDSASKVGQDTAPLCTIYRNVNGILAELQKSAFGVLSKKLKACDLYTEKLREDYENKLKAATAAIPAPAAISAPAAKPAAKSTLIAPSVTKTTPPVNVSAKLTKPSRPSYAQTLRNSANHVKLDSDVLSVKELRAKIAQTPSLKNLDVAAVTGGDKKLVLHFTNPSEKKRFVDNVKTANIGGLKVQTNPTFKPRLAIFGIPGEKTEEQLVADIRCHPAVEKLLKSADDIRMVKLIRKEGSSSTAIIEVNKVIETALLGREFLLDSVSDTLQLDNVITLLSDEDRECYASSRKKYLALLDLKRKGFDNEKQEILRNAKDSKTFWKTIALYKSTSIIQGEISIQDWLNFYRELMTTEKNLRICNLHNVISQNDPILDSEITNADIYKEIAGLRSNKACGPDGIPNEVLKTLPDSYILLLKQLYNSVMTTGKYPAIWTNSTIHPIFKNGYKNSPSNYRGIALISNVSKLFTSILRSRLEEWVEGRRVIPENQAGFRKERSCIDHIFTLTTLIQLSLRKKRGKLYVFFVDLRKAFDTVPHSLLWKKLYNLGISYQFISTIKSYYEQATIAIRWKGSFTESIKINSGVLQGEPLSPLLFILFITDLIEIYNNSDLPSVNLPEFGDIHLLLYADDIAIIGSVTLNKGFFVVVVLSDEVFHSCIQTIPSKPNKPGKIKNASWWKPEFNPLQKATLKAERAWRRARGAVRGVLKVFHKKLYNRFRATIRKAKQEEWKRVCSQCEVNPWGGIYQFIRGKHKKKPLSSLSVGAGFTDSQRDTLDHVLQHYFGRVPPDSMLGHSNLHRALQSISDNDPPFSEVELQLAADKVRLSSSPGSDGMPPVLCVKLIKKFRPFFLKIFNRCLVTGHFPVPCKLGDVILIPKKGGEDFLASHRPITMLPSLGKILERLILARLSWRAERMCKAQPNQFGFRPCKSTIAALLKLKNTLSRSLDLFKSAILLSFDVKGAFDNVLHSSILRALRKSDCPKNVHDLIRSFLAHRSVRLSVNGCTVTRRVSKGCPQACRAFRTTNNSSLITLSRVLPLDLEIDVKTQLYLKKYGYVDAEFPVEPPPSPQPLPYPPFLFLPSNIPELPPEVTYYTDGSKTNDGVGAGLYRVCVNDNFHELRVCYPLSRYCSVFQAEAFGLIKALENASELPIDTTVE
ncbi:hypothetical protein LAZ67_2005756, partial [Cordylochernes scorpioides]